MLLLIDNYDSFVHNLARYFQRLGQETLVLRNNATSVAAIRGLRPQAIVLSPGPCTPHEAGCTLEVARAFANETPMLGVCLGHQALAAAWGANIVRAPQPVHGRASPVFHEGTPLFAGVSSPFQACRYHSLVVEEASLPACFQVTARTADGTIMALEHISRPVVGVQFHPEAILTQQGYQLLANFLQLAGMSVAEVPEKLWMAEQRLEPRPAAPLPEAPVTF